VYLAQCSRRIEEPRHLRRNVAGDQDAAKIAAARYAIDHFVRPGTRIALGSGSTAMFAVRSLAERFPNGGFDCVASSVATERLATSLGLPVRPLRSDDRFDLMLDGADEVTPELDLTKGGGGALLREKLLAHLSDQIVILVDPSKLVKGLGEKFPIPVEVVPFARPVIEREATALGYRVSRRTDAGKNPFVTDNGNDLLDLVPKLPIPEPDEADATLHHLVGVIETGIFVELADRVIVGHLDGTAEDRSRPLARMH